jgi:predicted RNA binding protein YcfA (HicA-like mRNA interferase family)
MKLPLLSGKQVKAALKRLGFAEISRRGSHVKMVHSDGRKIVFPYHDEVDRYTLKGALNDAEIEIIPKLSDSNQKIILL